ncbi:hypothetical protein [Xenorhabdus sp. KK7.4]|uniref:hypothetical protein n=1 Tax=Xenorhabdus sp. KK7.4 TaxID=1851572 RepID=UPI000C04B38B|nr:hypothetical protein [Xenorhabdus sp. KK7.4]PHM48378.1 hypothetical protein Xekk_04447 [Xenorhabdus sp. KK7.4]
MLKHQHKRYQPVTITLPDGTSGQIIADRRCAIFYDFPPEVKIEQANNNQKAEVDSSFLTRKPD